LSATFATNTENFMSFEGEQVHIADFKMT